LVSVCTSRPRQPTCGSSSSCARYIEKNRASQMPAANIIATRGCWKVLPLPEIQVDLCFAESYTTAEFELIKRGSIPDDMEDKWFIFFEEPWVYVHRSWTGSGVFGAEFRPSLGGASVVSSWVGRSQASAATDYDRALLKCLIDDLLLGRPAGFAVPEDLPANVSKGVYQHHATGSACPQIMIPAGQAAAHSCWLLRFLK
jgi:hypothetical protein